MAIRTRRLRPENRDGHFWQSWNESVCLSFFVPNFPKMPGYYEERRQFCAKMLLKMRKQRYKMLVNA